MKQPTELLRLRFLIVLSAALVAVLLIALVNNINVGAPAAALAEGLCATILVVGFILTPKTSRLRVLPILILGVAFVLVHLLYIGLRGDSLAGAYGVSVMFPLIAGYFVSARPSLVWSGVFAASLMLHATLATTNIIESGLTWPNLIRILIVYALVVFITLGDRWITEVFTKSITREARMQLGVATQLRREYDAVKEAEQAKSLFVSLASHQLRSPLTALRWSLEAFRHDIHGLTPQQKEILLAAEASTMRLIRLVIELLNVSRIESGRLQLAPAATDVSALITNAVADVQPLAKTKDMHIEKQVPSTPLMLDIDPILISQVVLNFLSNAIKYSPKKGSVKISVTTDNDAVRCEVTDHGIGIPQADQEKIFQQMFRATNAQKLDNQGTGLGLFLAESIIHLSGGNIGFTSTENVGSTFWFTLPLRGSHARAGDVAYEVVQPG